MNAPAPDRIRLRRLRRADLRDFQAYRTDPKVARFQSREAMDDERAASFLEWCAAVRGFPTGWWQLGISRAEDDRLIGDMGLCLSEDGRQVQLGVTLASDVWGSGFGAEAVRKAAELVWMATDAGRIVAITDRRNAPALALVRRLGMRRVDTPQAGADAEEVFEMRRPEG